MRHKEPRRRVRSKLRREQHFRLFGNLLLSPEQLPRSLTPRRARHVPTAVSRTRTGQRAVSRTCSVCGGCQTCGSAGGVGVRRAKHEVNARVAAARE